MLVEGTARTHSPFLYAQHRPGKRGKKTGGASQKTICCISDEKFPSTTQNPDRKENPVNKKTGYLPIRRNATGRKNTDSFW